LSMLDATASVASSRPPTPVSNDAVAKLTHGTRGRSDDHEDGVAAAWHRADAIFTKLKFRKLRKSR
jgi:hypothetical protein